MCEWAQVSSPSTWEAVCALPRGYVLYVLSELLPNSTLSMSTSFSHHINYVSKDAFQETRVKSDARNEEARIRDPESEHS